MKMGGILMKKRIALWIALICAVLLCCGLACAEGYPESLHNYENNTDQTWHYTHPTSADYLAVTFNSNTELERGYDKIYITDSSGNTTTYSDDGSSLAGNTLILPGNSFTIRLTSDDSTTRYGFKIDEITIPVSASGVFAVGNKVCGYLGSSKAVVIPAKINNQAITTIGKRAFYGCDIESVTIPDSITSIESDAFYNNGYRITLKASLNSVARSYATGISYLAFECSVTGNNYPESKHDYSNFVDETWHYTYSTAANYLAVTFNSNTALESGCDKIYITDSSGTTTTYSDDGSSLAGNTLYFPGNSFTIRLTSDSSDTRYGFKIDKIVVPAYESAGMIMENGTIVAYLGTAETVNIPATMNGEPVTTIGDGAFRDAGMKRVTVPSSVRAIGNDAFYNCQSLTSIQLSEGLASIGSHFIQNTGVTELTIPDSVETVSSGAFYGLSGYVYATIGSSGAKAVSKANYRFRITSTPGIALQYRGSNYVDLYLYTTDSTLRSIDIPDGVNYIASSAFASNSRLSEVTFPGTLVAINESAFKGCSRLTSIELPYGLKTINASAFEDCINLSSIEIPYSVTAIGADAFLNCSQLLKIKGFRGSFAQVYAGQSDIEFVDLYGSQAAFGQPDFKLPASLKTISEEAFKGISATCVELPKGVKTIEKMAFADCHDLAQIYIPDSVTSISPDAFNGTSHLTIYGSAGSYADDFAYDNGFGFVEK